MKQQHRKSTDRYKPQQPFKMLFNNDPLNLAAFCDKESSDSPENSSPILDRSHDFEPANLLPIDVNDPLNLNSNNLDDLLLKPRKRRKRKRRNTFNSNEEFKKEDLDSGLKDNSDILDNDSVAISPVEYPLPDPVQTVKDLPTDAKPIFNKPDIISVTCDDKKKRNENVLQTSSLSECNNVDLKLRKKHYNAKNIKYKYGNYAHYYGSSIKDDQRLCHLRKEWFENKHCLDIGCNTGLFTCWIADNYSPKTIVGIDIDCGLIKLAKKNARERLCIQKNRRKFPLSFELTHRPISVPKLLNQSHERDDVVFKVENYTPPSDNLLQYIKPKYNTIVCLRVTKWVHLNFGDDGLKRMFKKIYLQLHPGGRLLLEPQMLNSYKKKKNLSEVTRKHFDKMKLSPTDFISYLLSNDVGFAQSECLGYTKRKKTGCYRPLYLLTKSGSFEKASN